MKTLLKKLRSRVNKYGYSQVSKDLGYYSDNAVRHWLDKQKVPKFKIEQVKNYLNQKGN